MKKQIETKIMLTLIIALAINKQNLSQNIEWEQTKGPLGGSVYSLAVDANGVVYTGTEQFGIFRSTNRGDEWLHTNLSSASFNCFTINQNGHIFTGTEGAIYRSTNGGASWQLLTSGLGSAIILSLGVTSNGTLFAGSEDGIFRSTNNGDTWSLVGLLGQQVNSVTIAQSGYIFAGTYYGGIWRSTDGGDTWAPTSVASVSVMSLMAIQSSTIFAGLQDGGVLRSTDNGDNWIQVGLSSMTVQALARDSSGLIFAATINNGIYRSIDNGTSWILCGLLNLPFSSISVSISGVIFAGAFSWSYIGSGTNGGVYLSNDDGNNWIKVGLPNTIISALTIPFAGSAMDKIFAGTDTVVLSSTDNGDSWLQTGSLPHPGYLGFGLQSLFTTTSGAILAGSYQWGVYRTSNYGTSWTNVGLANETVYSFLEKPNGSIFTSTLSAVYMSTDNGNNWGITGGNIPGSWFSSLATNSSGEIFVGMINRSDSAYIYRSTNNGQSWVPTGMTFQPVMKLLITEGDTIFAGCAFSGGGIFRSTDDGISWLEVSTGLINRDIYALVKNSVGDLFAGTAGGVFRSRNNGDLWEPINLGLTFQGIQSLELNSIGVLFAGTYGGGVFRTKQSTTSVYEIKNDKPALFSLKQNYPNPFNPSTKISWQSPVGSWQTLKIFDVLGNEVATLVDEYKPAGSYEVEFNNHSSEGRNLSSGVYFYQLKAENYIETKKMILLK